MKEEVYETVLTFNLSIDWAEFVVFVMPTQGKYYSSYTKYRINQPAGL